MKMTFPARLGMSVSGLKLLEDIAPASSVRVVVEKWKKGMLLLMRYSLVGTSRSWIAQSNLVTRLEL